MPRKFSITGSAKKRGTFMAMPSRLFQLWQLDIAELVGHNIEAKGREEVNRLLQTGWILLYIYTLKYRENGTWRQRPMAILGRPKSVKKTKNQ